MAKNSDAAPATTKRKRIPTRDRLKHAARKLFAERGIAGTTVRDILSEAREKNGASLNYYFGSKDGLIREIIADVFELMEERWNKELEDLESKGPGPWDLREYVRMIVRASNTSDVEKEPNTARLTEALTHHHYRLVGEIVKEKKYQAYDRILALIAANLDHLPNKILRQRLLLLTRYFTSVFALFEAARLDNAVPRSVRLPRGADLGNITDTAVGILTAEVVDAVDVTD